MGLPPEYWQDVQSDLAAALTEAVAVLKRLGHVAHDVSLPHTTYAVPAYCVISGAEASTNLSRYDGVRYGHRAAQPKDLDDLYRRSRSEGFGAEVKRRILTGAYTLSVGYYDAYYKKAQRLRRLVRQDFLQAFDSVDVIVVPTTPSVAFESRASGDPAAMYRHDMFTVQANLAGLPALSIPCGMVGGLPVGLQILGPHFAEDRLLALAEAYQRETDWHRRTPSAAMPERTNAQEREQR